MIMPLIQRANSRAVYSDVVTCDTAPVDEEAPGMINEASG
jgi:hypothetical protein